MGATWSGGQSWDGEEAKEKKEPIMACNLRMWHGVDLDHLKYKDRIPGKSFGKAYELGE